MKDRAEPPLKAPEQVLAAASHPASFLENPTGCNINSYMAVNSLSKREDYQHENKGAIRESCLENGYEGIQTRDHGRLFGADNANIMNVILGMIGGFVHDMEMDGLGSRWWRGRFGGKIDQTQHKETNCDYRFNSD